jgi:hypothetical protein
VGLIPLELLASHGRKESGVGGLGGKDQDLP